MNDGLADFGFDMSNLPVPDIEDLPQRGDFRLLRSGVKGSVPIGPTGINQLKTAHNFGEHEEIAHRLVAESSLFVVQRSPQSAEIAHYLENKGVPVEKLRKESESINIPLEDGEYISERLGKHNLQQALRQASGSARTELLRNYAHTLASIHLNDVIYGGNHAGNMICGDNNEVSFIDFTTSHQEHIDWQNMDRPTCLLTFVPELSVLVVQNLAASGCSDEEIKYCLDQVISAYPISNDLKSIIRQRTFSDN